MSCQKADPSEEEKLDQPLDGTRGSANSRGKMISDQGCEQKGHCISREMGSNISSCCSSLDSQFYVEVCLLCISMNYDTIFLWV